MGELGGHSQLKERGVNTCSVVAGSHFAHSGCMHELASGMVLYSQKILSICVELIVHNVCIHALNW